MINIKIPKLYFFCLFLVCALTILVLWLTLSIGNGFPTNSVAEEPLIEDSNTNSNHSKFNKTNESIFASRNSSARYLKNSPFRENRYTTAPPIVTQSSIKVFESTTNNPNIANRINFRGSVKYFATRPTYKPKVANPRRNVTRYRHESSDTIKTIVNANKTENLIVREPTEKFTVKKEIKEPTKTIKTDLAQNDKNIKQQNDFNIDRYTSPEFHDINNVYSQSVSPEIQQFIVPGNVSDYFVSVGSSPYVSPADSNSDEDEEEDDYYSNDMTTPKITFFDSKFREVSKQIKQNLADAAFETESSFLEDDKTTTEKMENRMTMDFKELLSRPPNNHTKVMYKNTKEIILTDSQNSLSDHKDLVDMNGTRIFYEMSMVSTEKYDHKSSTMRMLPDSSEENEITTPRPQEKIVAADSMPPEISKRLDRFRSNETRKEYPTTIRMRPPTTPRPRVRISLKTPSTTSPSYESTVGTKTPETVKMIPYSRRLPWLTTVSSKIDPVYQESSGPPKIVGRTRPDSENSIVGLRKRGSNKYSNITSSDTSAQLVIPPTATAWALITLKDTPFGKKNETKEEVSTPVETENPTDLTTTIVKG